jgi:hypothetical protein
MHGTGPQMPAAYPGPRAPPPAVYGGFGQGLLMAQPPLHVPAGYPMQAGVLGAYPPGGMVPGVGTVGSVGGMPSPLGAGHYGIWPGHPVMGVAPPGLSKMDHYRKRGHVPSGSAAAAAAAAADAAAAAAAAYNEYDGPGGDDDDPKNKRLRRDRSQHDLQKDRARKFMVYRVAKWCTEKNIHPAYQLDLFERGLFPLKKTPAF